MIAAIGGSKMVYEHKGKKANYFLHQKGKLYYFAKKKGVNSIDMPKGYKVIVNEKTGLPFIKKK